MATQKLVEIVSVIDLAAGASLVVPHDLSSGGVAVAPTEIAPDRATPIVVDAVTESTVTFRNDSSVTTSANFRLGYQLSIIANPEMAEPFLWGGVPFGGGGGVPGPVGPQGAQGIQGQQGIQGPQGIQGAPGTSVTIEGTVATVDDLATKPQVAGQGWIVAADGDLYIWSPADLAWESVGQIVGPQGPQGAQGTQGIQGPAGTTGTAGAAATIVVGTVTGLPAGSTPKVTNEGTATAAIFKFEIPAGATGATGAQGPQGIQGIQGPQGPQGDPGTNAVVGVAAGTYGSATSIPVVVVNASNQITSITPTAIQTPYDLAGEVVGTLTAPSDVFHFKAVRAFSLSSSGAAHRFSCVTAPTSAVELAVIKVPAVGSPKTLFGVNYAIGATSATVTAAPGTVAADFDLAVGDVVKVSIVTLAGGDAFSTPFFTLFGTAA